MKADKSKSPEVEQQLVELGNSQKAIPFYAIYAPGLEEPITFSGLITASGVIDELKKLKSSSEPKPTAFQQNQTGPIIAAATVGN